MYTYIYIYNYNQLYKSVRYIGIHIVIKLINYVSNDLQDMTDKIAD